MVLAGAAAALIFLLIFAANVLLAQRNRERRNLWAAVAAQARAIEQENVKVFEFGPMIERILTAGQTNDFLDLDTGAVLHQPANPSPDPDQHALSAWASESGADLGFVTNLTNGTAELIGFAIGKSAFARDTAPEAENPFPAATNVWQNLEPEQLLEKQHPRPGRKKPRCLVSFQRPRLANRLRNT